MEAGHDVHEDAAIETLTESHSRQEVKTGWMTGSLSIGYGTRAQSLDEAATSTSAAGSTIGSTSGNVSVTAGNTYSQVGSRLVASQGDIDVDAQKVEITAAHTSSHNTQEMRFKQSGVTLALSAPAISALQGAQRMAQAAGKTDDPRMKLLAAGNAGMGAMGSAAATQKALAEGDKSGGVKLSLTVGSSQSTSQTTVDTTTAVGSSVEAGGHVNITAHGAGQDSSLRIEGSRVKAAGDVTLQAEGDVELVAAKNTVTQQSDSHSSSAAAGIAVSFNKNGAAYRVAAHAAAGALGGGVLGAAGAAASAALVPTIAQAVDALDLNLPAAVRAVVIAAAGTATGAVVGGTSGAAAAANQTVNNYLKHEELQAKRQEMAACKTAACTTAVTRKWEAVSQKRDAQMTGSCLDGASAQCHANVQQLMTDLAALNQGEGKSKSPESEEEGQNIREVQTLLRVNVDQLVQRGVAAMGENAKSLNDLVKAGYLTPTEAEVVQSQPGEMLRTAQEMIAVTLGTKTSKSTTSATARQRPTGTDPELQTEPTVVGVPINGATRTVPLGFSPPKQFTKAAQELQEALVKSGITDATVGVRGSSITGVSFANGSPFGLRSDIDFYIESQQLTNGYKTSRNIPGFVHPGKILPDYPLLQDWSNSWTKALGRDVTPGAFVPGTLPLQPTIAVKPIRSITTTGR